MLGPKYAFISAYLKGEEAKIVTAEHIDKLMAAPDLQEALAIIRATDIGGYLEGLSIRDFDYLDQCLWGYLAQRIRYIETFKFLPEDILKVSRAYVVKYDVSNMKSILQGIATGKKASMIPIGTIHDNGLQDKLLYAEGIDDIIPLLVQCKLGDYVAALEQYKTDKSAKSKFTAEVKLDSQYYKNMLNMARKIKDGSVLSQAFGLVIDLTNLQIASRAILEGIGPGGADLVIAGGYRITDKTIKELLPLKLTDIAASLEVAEYRDIVNEIAVTYDKAKSITAVDEIIDKHKLRILKEILSPRVLSPLVMAWYLVLKETEIRNLRLVLKAIIDGIPVQEVKTYLAM